MSRAVRNCALLHRSLCKRSSQVCHARCLSHSSKSSSSQNILQHDEFSLRHIGPRPNDQEKMLQFLGHKTLDELTDATVPENIRLTKSLEVSEPLSEHEVIGRIKEIFEYEFYQITFCWIN